MPLPWLRCDWSGHGDGIRESFRHAEIFLGIELQWRRRRIQELGIQSRPEVVELLTAGVARQGKQPELRRGVWFVIHLLSRVESLRCRLQGRRELEVRAGHRDEPGLHARHGRVACKAELTIAKAVARCWWLQSFANTHTHNQ